MHTLMGRPATRILFLLAGLASFIPGCLPGLSGLSAASPAPFLAPTSLAAAPTPLIAPAFTLPPQPTALALATATPASGTAGALALPSETPPCTSSLRFLQDVNYPDDTLVAPGQQILKSWLVENNGTCDWDSRYRLRLSGGTPMGATAEQALYPARAGTQANVQIAFTAPDAPGVYRSEWRAHDPNGNPMGDTLYIQIDIPSP